MRPTTQSQGVMLQHQQKFAAPPPPALQNQAPTKTAKILIGLEQSPQAFNLRSRIIGETGANLHYIRTETGALATLRGRGSMFIDISTGCESQEPLHLYIEHPTFEGLKEAEHLAKNLVETLQQELNLFQEPNSPKPQLNNQPPPGGLLQQPQLPSSNQVALAPPLIPPPAVLAVPPPSHIIQSNGIPQTIIHQQQQQQQAFIQQNSAQMQQPQNTIIQQQQQQQTIIHQQPQHHISQMHQPLMIPQVQQQTLGNVNLPPPGVLQRQQTTLSQPPPNIQFQAPQPHQQQQPQATQITMVNQGPPQYHYQYIQTNGAQIQPGQLTIQHLIQQPHTGLMQTTTIPQQIEHLQQQQQHQQGRQPQQQQQQIITVQGNTFMVPPPNLIQQQHLTHQQPHQQILFHQQQPQIIHQPPPAPPIQHLNGIQMLHQQQIDQNATEETHSTTAIKEEIKSNDEQSPIKSEGKDNSNNQSPSQLLQQPPLPPSSMIRQNMIGPPTTIISQPPPSIMSMPPPGVQQQAFNIVGNNIITTTQQPTQHQITHIPVSIQQQIQPQQIQMTPNGQQFLVHSQQWATTGPQQIQQQIHTHQPPQQHQQQHIQQIHHFPPNQMQNIQFTTQTIRNPNEIQFISQHPTISISGANDLRTIQQQPITTATFNPQLQPPTGLQVQFHQVPSSQIIHQMPPNQQIFEQQQHQQQFLSNLQPPFSLMQQHQQQQQSQQPPSQPLHPPPPSSAQLALMESKMNRNEHSPTAFPGPGNNGKQNSMDNRMAGQKRKHDDEEGSPPTPNTKPKMGMGSNSGGNTPINTTANSGVSTTMTSINSDKSNAEVNAGNILNAQQQQQQHQFATQMEHHQQHLSPPNFLQHEHNRPYYQREMMENFQQDNCEDSAGHGSIDDHFSANIPPHGSMRNFRPPPSFFMGGRPPLPPGRFSDGNYPNRFPPPMPPNYRGDNGGYGPPRFRQW